MSKDHALSQIYCPLRNYKGHHPINTFNTTLYVYNSEIQRLHVSRVYVHLAKSCKHFQNIYEI